MFKKFLHIHCLDSKASVKIGVSYALVRVAVSLGCEASY